MAALKRHGSEGAPLEVREFTKQFMAPGVRETPSWWRS